MSATEAVTITWTETIAVFKTSEGFEVNGEHIYDVDLCKMAMGSYKRVNNKIRFIACLCELNKRK